MGGLVGNADGEWGAEDNFASLPDRPHGSRLFSHYISLINCYINSHILFKPFVIFYSILFVCV